jgi:putative transposase
VQLPKTIRLPHAAYADTEAVFHVVFHTATGTTPFRNTTAGDRIWQLVVNERERDSIELVAACLMPDHLHVVASPRRRGIIAWVNGFKSYSTHVGWEAGLKTALWQPGFYDRRLRSADELDSAVEYVVRNPVAAGLVEDADSWPWARSWLGEHFA